MLQRSFRKKKVGHEVFHALCAECLIEAGQHEECGGGLHFCDVGFFHRDGLATDSGEEAILLSMMTNLTTALPSLSVMLKATWSGLMVLLGFPTSIKTEVFEVGSAFAEDIDLWNFTGKRFGPAGPAVHINDSVHVCAWIHRGDDQGGLIVNAHSKLHDSLRGALKTFLCAGEGRTLFIADEPGTDPAA